MHHAQPDFERKAHLAAVCLWLGIVVTSIGSLFIDESDWESWWFEGIQFLVATVPVAVWVIYDSKAKGMKEKDSAGYIAGAFVLAPILVPIYVVKTRGWAEGKRWALRTTGLLLSAVATVIGAAFVLDYLGKH